MSRDGLIAVVHRPRQDDWSLPKGKLEEGEDDATAALREVEEEVGWTAAIDADLGTVHYTLPDGRPKLVHWYAMHAVAQSRIPADDVDGVRWLEPGAAAELFTYALDAEVLARAAAHGPHP